MTLLHNKKSSLITVVENSVIDYSPTPPCSVSHVTLTQSRRARGGIPAASAVCMCMLQLLLRRCFSPGGVGEGKWGGDSLRGDSAARCHPLFPHDLDLALSEDMYRERGGRGPVLPLLAGRPAGCDALPGEGTAFTARVQQQGKQPLVMSVIINGLSLRRFPASSYI